MTISNASLATRLREHIGLASPGPIDWARGSTVETPTYSRTELRYRGREGDAISGYLFAPTVAEACGAVIAFHQHAGQFHLGKSEVAGDLGEPLQAFGPALAARGVMVLAPDALTFEDRRAQTSGTEPDDGDWLQHFNAMAYHILRGDAIMRKCLDDAQRALSVLLHQPGVDPTRVGVLGHSYGGTTALYHGVVDSRVRFAAVSGALCSFEHRQNAGTGPNMFEVVPDLLSILEAHDLVAAMAPRPLLVVSADQDPYSADAPDVVGRTAADHVTAIRVEGQHALDGDRFRAIVDWTAERASR